MPIYANSGRRSVIPDFYRRVFCISALVKEASFRYKGKKSLAFLEKRKSSPYPLKIGHEQLDVKLDKNPVRRKSIRASFYSKDKKTTGHENPTIVLNAESIKPKKNKESVSKDISRKSECPLRSTPKPDTINRNSMYIRRSSSNRKEIKTDNKDCHDLALLCQLYLIRAVIPKIENEDLNLNEEFNRKLDVQYFEYYPFIFQYLCVRETMIRVNNNYLSVNNFSPSFRCILIDWLIKVQIYSKIQNESLHVAVTLIDMFTSVSIIRRSFYQLVGVTCLLIACKVVQRFHPKIKDLCHLTDNCYKPFQVLQMERIVLEKLDFFVNVPIASHFCHRGLLACIEILNTEKLDCFCNFMFDMITLDPASPGFRPSCRAAAALLLGRYIFYPEYSPWTKILHHYTLYSQILLKECVTLYVHMLANIYDISDYKYTAVVDKYSLPIWHKIATDKVLIDFSTSAKARDTVERLFD